MADDIPFEREDAAVPGRVETLSPLIRRILCDNPGPFTFKGTVTYVVGTGRVAIIDPGPDDPRHVAAVLEAVKGETVEAILVTHTHRDHSPATPAIKAATGAPVYAEGPHRAARPLNLGETNVLDASGDRDFTPDIAVKDGDVVTGTGWTLESVFTPGHTANHMAFALREEQTLFSGDHVMAWSTSIVAPPDGAMGDYMASLDKLRARDETLFWPGHGGPVKEPAKFMRALAHHRRLREAAIMKRLGLGDRHIPDIVAAIYEGLDPRLKSAAGLSVFAHLEDLVGRGLVASDGPASLTGAFRPA
ncbi:MBL fold metallo-hydrolase [Phreatobacter oligotrophus]|jgi:glyoxylase-like metal-dependent hydrolase (beta-lactamase superfamily II)|uniref:Glyoxylase-like metal-dependent hydrolase (Beta-lactamase superfamily II) n=1 Tax=Phreatobacter oligotrophus TaxID=1122261 RepID=A0A2T4ZFR1_9HYPH|nr:MBL fold metallo-hydrolase [Phreatobacter oligotrophus]PTM60748.1 glyoxylase-like metal-dependent hydrolase (beta-lactamase superfamily II) [Phreatobacter oligotrophus]